MNEFVIYTVMVGDYGSIYQPEIVDSRFDYVIFSNSIREANVGIWEVKRFPESSANDNKRLSRYPKTHPVTLLSGYAASLYIDANVQIRDQWVYDRFVELYNSSINIAGVQLVYTGRDCIYSHSYDMCVMRAEHDYNAIVQMHELRKRGFPEHFGLNENNLIWRRHNLLVKTVDDEWWWWITNYSYRDQFSYMYCLWKFEITRFLFLPAGEDTGNSSHFRRIPHNELKEVAEKKWVTPNFFEKYRNRCRNSNENLYDLYRLHWLHLTKLPFPRVALFIWGLMVSAIFVLRHIKSRIFLHL